MKTETFRKAAHRLVDWIADYLDDPTGYAVLPDVSPGEIRAEIDENAPDEGQSFEAIFSDFKAIVAPGMTHWNHPGFFAYFPANHSPPSVLAEMLAATTSPRPGRPFATRQKPSPLDRPTPMGMASEPRRPMTVAGDP